jgi:hypothetical protein
MNWKRVTACVCIATVALLLVYDGVAALLGGQDATISLVITNASRWPIIPFAFGLLCGHLFAQNTPST